MPKRPQSASTVSTAASEGPSPRPPTASSQFTQDMLDDDEVDLLPSWDEPEPLPAPEPEPRPATAASSASRASRRSQSLGSRPSTAQSRRSLKRAESAPGLRKEKPSAAVNFLSQTMHHTQNPYTTTKVVDMGDRWSGKCNDIAKGTKRRDLLTWGVSREGEGRAAYLRASYSRCPAKRYVTPATCAQ